MIVGMAAGVYFIQTLVELFIQMDGIGRGRERERFHRKIKDILGALLVLSRASSELSGYTGWREALQ